MGCFAEISTEGGGEGVREKLQPSRISATDTLPGTKMEVENDPLNGNFPLQTGGFPLPCLY